jgi:hypothetical protein
MLKPPDALKCSGGFMHSDKIKLTPGTEAYENYTRIFAKWLKINNEACVSDRIEDINHLRLKLEVEYRLKTTIENRLGDIWLLTTKK